MAQSAASEPGEIMDKEVAVPGTAEQVAGNRREREVEDNNNMEMASDDEEGVEAQ
ncbi:hypothetical protein H4R26_002298, partial [Coemansia thaxteri]